MRAHLSRMTARLTPADHRSTIPISSAYGGVGRNGNGCMTDEHKALADRVAALEARVAELGTFLHSAVAYLSSDPASSLTKSRVILEKLLLDLYRGAMKKDPPRPMIGDILADRVFTATIPRRIAARMNAIRDMSNLGPHGEEVDASDAIRVMRDLIDVLEWYVVHRQPSYRAVGDHETRRGLEILPELREKYPRYLRPDITSVSFVQSQDQCYLEITTADRVNDSLTDETTRRTDLAFIANSGGGGDPFFSPARSITENAHRFLTEFDAVSIINCTDLFTHEAAMRIDAHWRQHKVIPEGEGAAVDSKVGGVMSFANTWQALQAAVLGVTIPNWTMVNGLLGDSFLVAGVAASHIEVASPNAASIQRIPKADFEAVYRVWPAYCIGTHRRQDIRDSTRFSKYIISIYHWLEGRSGGRLP